MPSSAILKCNICPRKPNFSDVSHLLTHVSSKGHLSHYFKLQVRSHQEPGAGELLAEYDQWYSDHNLAGLLSERMLAKEARKVKGRSAVTYSNNLPNRRASTSMIPPSAHGPARTDQRHIPSYVDPDLSQSYSMAKPHSSDPRVQLWPGAPKRRSLPTRASAQIAWKVEFPESDEGEDMSPLAHRARAPLGWSMQTESPTGHRNRRPVTPDPFLDDASYEEDDDESEQREEISKLKGILWPGMDIFDSATEQMRRKRNQKKDGSVLKQMEKTSETVEPTELVFSPGGTLRKARLISGMVDDSSPLKGETPIPKKRVTRPRRQPLSQVNPNRILRSHTKLRKPNGQDRPMGLECYSRQSLSFMESPQHDRRNAHFGAGFGMQDENFRLSFQTFEQKSSHGFEVFKDGKDHNNGVDFSLGPKSFYNPLGSSSSLALNHQARNLNGLKHFSGKSIHIPEYRGKENIEPNLTQRLDGQYMEPNWDPMHLATDSRYGSQYLYGTALHSYTSFGETDSFGYPSNPLSCSLAQIQQNGDQKRSSSVVMTGLLESPVHNVPKSGREVSPDGTVSEIDQDDLGQMYFNEFTA
ncbi:hypothetical protein CPC735_043870 [Coccidioides posadasii C735 delta SOWgp]|uniref:Uncharacterized protein n=1 Tax=Coccidioides posadasii (strain C735) TaxID=222929 RepID=C5PBF9_COCP7|nr:hypothetical protein CPC735_043870 [Coccidioides posadasii C735 delta SOWgp]EER25943.1 hypothetical protein CPC735_043870 [Coccidioides posadasii C735 delta SOWgp]|eukprot:XP_003068088.1 hypothetical protein CPC735_043870 [Coccidioides posadasii C735 delta SOWgp]